jgi:hypothetical protein
MLSFLYLLFRPSLLFLKVLLNTKRQKSWSTIWSTASVKRVSKRLRAIPRARKTIQGMMTSRETIKWSWVTISVSGGRLENSSVRALSE